MKQNGQKGFGEQSAVLFRKNGQSGGRVATVWCGSRRKATFLENSKFFFTLYHAGQVNIPLHIVSFSFLLYGLIVKSMPPCSLGCLFSMRWGMPTITFLCITGTLDSVCEWFPTSFYMGL